MDIAKPAVLVVLLFGAGCVVSGSACAGDIRGQETLIADRMLAALIEANGVPGMGAAVVVDGDVVWAGSAGFRDLDARLPVDRNTVFRLASVSKLITATAAAKLREEGRLDVDAPVQSMLPWLKAPWVALTPRQLAAHTSGLPHYQYVDRDRGAIAYATVRDAVGVFDSRALRAVPGTRYAYSSWGYTLLSAAVEARAGMPFLDFVAGHITPGLVIGADDAGRGHPKASRMYGFSGGRRTPIPAHDFSYTWGGGGLAATPEAIALFGSRVMDGQVVSRSTFEWMLQPTRLSDGSLASDGDYKVGFGWRVGSDFNGEPIAHHAGVTDGARSALVLWPGRNVSASVLSNAKWVSSIEQTAAMLAAPFQDRSGASGMPTESCPVEVVRYEAQFGAARLGGAASFRESNGICTGRIGLEQGELRDWLNGFPQRDTGALEIIGVQPRRGLGRAALVTPIGLHDMRPHAGKPGFYRIWLSQTRTLSIRFIGGVNGRRPVANPG